jgi:hypothetical protein
MGNIDYSSWGNVERIWVLIGVILFAALGAWLLRQFFLIHLKGGE